MIEIIDFNFFSLFLQSIILQGSEGEIFGIFSNGREALGSDDPIIKGVFPTLFAVSGFGIMLNFFNSTIRKKVVDQKKLKRIMNETKSWQKERISAIRSKDQEKIMKLNQKSAYMNKMSMEMMQMNMKPMIFTIVPMILIFYFVLPHLFTYTVALSPISLNIFPVDFFHLTCTSEQAIDPDNVCTQENAIYLWAWYFLSSIAFSGIIMKITKTSMGVN
ncbi:MAG: EMC3/TMCO1 family protein [Nitrosopumilaceae archaeon]